MKTYNISKLITLIVIAAGTLFLNSCNYRSIKGNGSVGTEDREVSEFTKIQVSSALTVIYTQAPEYSVKVEADDNLIKYIVTRVVGKELQIKVKDGVSFRKETKTEIHVSGPYINDIEVSGASEFRNTNTLDSDNLSLQASGASIVNLKGIMSSLTGDFSGASNIIISGKTTLLNLEASGASIFSAGSFESDVANIKLSGASIATVNVKDNLTADLSGASELSYYGSPSINQDLSGSSILTQK